MTFSSIEINKMNESKARKKEKGKKEKRIARSKVNFTRQNAIIRDKRELFLETDDQRQSAEICLPFNGTVFPDCFLLLCNYLGRS